MSIQNRLQQYSQEAYAAYENMSGEEITNPDGSLKGVPGLGHNDSMDACRHAYVSAVLTYDSLEFVAYVLGAGYEILGELADSPQPPGEHYMDEWNNAEGREIGQGLIGEIRLIENQLNIYSAYSNRSETYSGIRYFLQQSLG